MPDAAGAVFEPPEDSTLPLVAIVFGEDGQVAIAKAVTTVIEGDEFIEFELAHRKARAAPMAAAD